MGAVDRNDGYVFGHEVASRSRGGQPQGELVGHTFNQDDRAHSRIVPSSTPDGSNPQRSTKNAAASRGCPSTADNEWKGEYALPPTLKI